MAMERSATERVTTRPAYVPTIEVKTPPVAEAAQPSRWVSAAALAGLLAAAAFFRLWNSTAQSLRLDEGFSIRFAAHPILPVTRGGTVVVPSLFQVVSADVHPPGYFLLLHVWMRAFGANLAVLRLPSELAGLLAVPALFLLARSLYSPRVALLATVLGAFSPFWIWHAQEARMYPFLLLFTIVSTYGLVEAIWHRHGWGWLVYGIGSVLAIYTHYYAFMVLAAQGLFVLAYGRSYGWRAVRTWFLVNVALAVSYVPWGLMLLANYRGASNPNLQQVNLYTPLTMLSNFLLGYLSVPLTSQVVALWPLLVPLGLALGAFARGVSRRAILLWLLFALPIAVSFAVSLAVRPFYSVRYLVVSVPALYILIAVALDRFRGRVARVLTAGALIAISLVAWHVQETSPANPQAENYRSAVQYIEAHARPGDVVAVDAPYNQDAFSYYSHINLPVYALPFLQPATGAAVPTVSPTQLRQYVHQIEAGEHRLWVIYYLESNYDPHNLVRQYLAYHSAGAQVIYGGPYQRNQPQYPSSYQSVQLVRYQVIPRPAPATEVRPETVQESRALTNLSPTLRRPFASPFGAPGAQEPYIGPLLVPAQPARSWHFTAAPQPGDAHLTIFNPNPATVVVTVRTVDGTRVLDVPASANLAVAAGAWKPGEVAGALSLQAPQPITATRSVINGGRETIANAWPGPARSGTAAAAEGRAASGPVVQTGRTPGHARAAGS